MEAWKAAKRTFGWFAEQETEGMKARRGLKGLSLRQGFFTMARSFTKSKSEEKSISGVSLEKGGGNRGVLPPVREEV
jgi:hypothetical protein